MRNSTLKKDREHEPPVWAVATHPFGLVSRPNVSQWVATAQTDLGMRRVVSPRPSSVGPGAYDACGTPRKPRNAKFLARTVKHFSLKCFRGFLPISSNREASHADSQSTARSTQE